MKKKLAVIIGRFQMFHNGHMELFQKAFDECDHVLALIGSANCRLTSKNPFKVETRTMMLYASLVEAFGNRTYMNDLYVSSVDDNPAEALWEASVIDEVNEAIEYYGGEHEVIIYGHDKDASSYYIRSFPWKVVEVENKTKLDATDIRELWFANDQQVNDEIKAKVPEAVYRYLRDYWEKDDDRQADWQYYQDERKKFAGYPYPNTLTFNCGDSVVECAGHILLIQRKHAPGRGAWALPGGFKENTETFFECAIRELYEETNLRVSKNVVLGSVVDTHMFDNPNRSQGIPRCSLAVHIKIKPDPDGKMPRANGCDDAAEIQWALISDILDGNIQLYDDHSDIVRHFVTRNTGKR